ncbi:hypothetical protein JCM8547_005996 [Rhodosporidiobolus lusitaniae]
MSSPGEDTPMAHPDSPSGAQAAEASGDERSPPPSDDDDDAVDLRPGMNHDSSEEEQTDSDEEREVRKGFIVDEDDSRRRRRKKKRSKRRAEGEEGESRKRRKDSDDESVNLDEDDLDLLNENLGITRSKPKQGKLKRLRRAHRDSDDGGSGSDPDGASSSRRRTRRDGSVDDLRDIFNDDDDDGRGAGRSSSRRDGGGRGGAGAEGLFDADEMAGFIEDDEDDSDGSRGGGGGGSDSDESGGARRRRKEKKRRERKEARKKRGMGMGMGRVEGITAEAWGEVAEVFGNGQDYAWAMEDEEEEGGEDKVKELKDIFEPSEIASRMLTEEDEKIRTTDVPERMQLANVGLPSFTLTFEGDLSPLIAPSDLHAAAVWMASKLPKEHTVNFFLRDEHGNLPPLHDAFLTAVETVVKLINVDFCEPPHIWHNKADHLFFAPSGTDPAPLLSEDHVWRIAALSVKYRAFKARKDDLDALWKSLGVVDPEVEDVLEQLSSQEEVQDAMQWVATRWSDRVRDAKKAKKEGGDGGEEGEGEEKEQEPGVAVVAGGIKRPKRATSENAYAQAKKSVVSKLAAISAIPPTSLALDVASQNKSHFPDDPDKEPLALANEYVDESAGYRTPEAVLAAAKLILTTELGLEPLLKKEVRRFFRDFATVTVEATKAGETKIDQLNPYYAFKYLKSKPLNEFSKYPPQWLQILAAESEGLITVTISLPDTASDSLFNSLRAMYLTDYASALAEEWNRLRAEVLKSALEGALSKEGVEHAKTLLREEAEEFVAYSIRRRLASRIESAPWCREDGTMEPGQTPSVLAISNGNGDPKRDSVVAVFLDADGHFREHLVLDKISAEMDDAQRESLTELLRRRRPQVVVVGGYRPSAVELMGEFRRFAGLVSETIVNDGDADADDEEQDPSLSFEERIARKRNRAAFESTYVFDEVARIYQNSPRAAMEFSELSTIGKYCVGLARYIQSPLNEYAALGADLSALSYDPNQKLLSKEKVIAALERSLIETTSKVGVDINKAVRIPYYAHLLPYVSGLGPRKADGVIKKINAKGGTLATRSGLVLHQIMTKNVWVNASAFLRIRQDDLNADLLRDTDNDEDPDVLDDTRIHPEDYDVARKMAADAMEYDEEDLEGAAPSKAVVDLFDDDVRKLNDLALDEFAEELSKVLGQPKRLTLYKIREELQRPFGERRGQFAPPNDYERFTMFTGETRQTLDSGLIIPVRVMRVNSDETVIVRLDCGIEGTIASEYRTNGQTYAKLRAGQTLQAAVMDVRYNEMRVELTTQETIVGQGDAARRHVQRDQWFDAVKEDVALKTAGQASQKKTGRVKRIIAHPNFQDVSSGKAEELLSNMQRGDCIIRPSSREDHIAVTWKVDEGIYQHIAVHELDKPDEYSLGTDLRIGHKHRYSDLDELIDAHIKQMARKVNEMTSNEKFKGKKEQLDTFLQNWTLANPGKSIYAFGWDDDRRKPGTILLGFRTNEKTAIQYWRVTVVPEGYTLKDSVHGDVQQLTNAFKTAYAYSMTGAARQAPNPNLATGRTPYLQSGRTPNPALAAGGGRTPNPYYGQQQQQQQQGYGGGYGGGRTPGYQGGEGRTPGYQGGPQGGYGGGYGQQHLPAGVAAAQQATAQGGIPGLGGRTPNIYAGQQYGQR